MRRGSLSSTTRYVRLLELVLSRAGYTNVRTTRDSRTVAATIRDWGPDLVLLDLAMPPPDGYEILQQIQLAQSASERIPILVLTADVTGPARERAFVLGASDFLTKPFDRTEVLLRIRNLLSTRFLERAPRAQNEALETRGRGIGVHARSGRAGRGGPRRHHEPAQPPLRRAPGDA